MSWIVATSDQELRRLDELWENGILFFRKWDGIVYMVLPVTASTKEILCVDKEGSISYFSPTLLVEPLDGDGFEIVKS